MAWQASYGYTTLKVSTSETKINTSNNTSQVNVKVELYFGGTPSTFNANPQTLVVKVDGSTIRKQTGITYSLTTGNRTKVIGEWSKVVTHNSDGSKYSDIEVSMTDGRGQNAVVKDRVYLSTIARATQPYLENPSVYFGDTIIIKLPLAHNSFRHKIRYTFESIGSKTEGVENYVDAWTGTRFTPPNSLASAIPNAISGTGTIYVTTFNGSSEIGTKKVDFTLSVPNTAEFQPTVSNVSTREMNSLVSSNFTVWVKDNSAIRISGVATPKYSASIASARIYIDGEWHKTNVVGNTLTIADDFTPSKSWQHNYSVEATDSRGRSNKSGGTLTVQDYTKPRLATSVGRSETSGSVIELTSKVTGTNIQGKNTLLMELYIKESTVTNWGGKIFPTGVSSLSNNGVLDWGLSNLYGYSELKTYDVKVQVKDKLTDWVVATSSVATSTTLMDAYRDIGVSFGRIYDEFMGGVLQVGGLATFDGDIEQTGNGRDVRYILNPQSGNASMEIGSTRVASTPYLDFHSSGNANDRDARIIATGGGYWDEQGTLDFRAQNVMVNGSNIFDYGFNSNGHYMKFNDGTLICWGREERNVPLGASNGNIFRSNTIWYSFPATFVGIAPIVTISAYDAMTALMTKLPRTGFDVMLFKGTPTSSLSTAIAWQAIGRWK